MCDAWKRVRVCDLQGFLGGCEKGGLAGQMCTGVRFVLKDGQHHAVDSSDWAFQQAAEAVMLEGTSASTCGQMGHS